MSKFTIINKILFVLIGILSIVEAILMIRIGIKQSALSIATYYLIIGIFLIWFGMNIKEYKEGDKDE